MVEDPDYDDSVYQPVYMIPEGMVQVTPTDEVRQTFYGHTSRGDTSLGNELCHDAQDRADVLISISSGEVGDLTLATEQDEHGEYIELCFEDHMANVILAEDQYVYDGEIATLRVYLTSAANKRAVVVKGDDLLTTAEMNAHAKEVSSAILTELNIWLQNQCFEMCDLKNAQNVMTSRYVCKWKCIKDSRGASKKVIRMRLVLRGCMDLEAFSLDTFAGTATRASQRIFGKRGSMQ